MIRSAVRATNAAMGVHDSADSLAPYYQYANRLAALHFLVSRNVAGRLRFIYFLGDTNPNAHCPTTRQQWEPALRQMYAHLGLRGNSELETRVHRIFLPVCPVCLRS